MSHVAFLIPTLDRLGGAERQLLLLARGLRARNWRVSVITLAGTGEAHAAQLAEQQIAFLSLRMRKGLADPRGWLVLNRWLRREKPDVLHAHLPHAAWMARWSRLLAPVRAVVDTVHTAGTGTWGRKLGYQCSNWLTDRVTVVSYAAAEAWTQAGLLPASLPIVLPNGIDTEHWKPDPDTCAQVRNQLGLRDEFLWLAAGRLEPVKDFATLLRAFAGLPPHARLVIAGEGSQRSALHSLAHSLGIASRVHMPGFVNDILPWMRAADGFVLSSLWEGLPMSLLEAGACAVPSVSTQATGAAEILPTTQLAKIADAESLHSAMLQLMQMPALMREQTGLHARELIEQRFSLPAVLDRWEALYAEILETNPKPTRAASAS